MMATAVRRAITPAEKAERDAEVRALLEDAIERVSADGLELVSFLVESAGWDYGWANRLLLWAQGCRGPVMSYSAWRLAGRNVKRGETGRWIYAGRFPRRGVFVASQTEGAPWGRPSDPEHPAVVQAMRVVFEGGGLDGKDLKGRKALLRAAVEESRLHAETCVYCAEEGCESCMG